LPSRKGRRFVAGDGLNKPRGFLDYPSVADDTSWSWGNLGFVATGAAGAFGTDPSDRLVELIYALKAGHRQNGRFVMNRKTQARSASSRMPTAIISGCRRRAPARPPR
jgi:HK97 family phage major capsid protein